MSEDELAALLAAKPEPLRGRFWVEAENVAWLVAEGAVDLFLQVRTREGAPRGPRLHVLRVPAGQAFFGTGALDLPGGRALIAVPLPGTRLHTLSAELLRRARSAEPVARWCEDWVCACTRALAKPAAPRLSESIASGVQLEAGADQIVRAAQRVLWIEVLEGNALWMERYDCVANAASGPLPLPRELWLKAAGPLKLRAFDTATLLDDERLWKALALHQRFVLRWVIACAEQDEAHEKSRLQARADQSLMLTREALQRLLSVSTGRETDAAAQDRRNACLAACLAIGPQAGIDFRMPHASDLASMDRDPIAAIAAASRVRHRQVALKGEWWSGDNGPLVAAFEDGGSWVALLPRRGGYQLHDPVKGESRPVTAQLARRLAPFATMFYAAMPERALRPRDVLAFLLRGRAGDLALVLALGALGGVLGLAAPLAAGVLVDDFIPSADVGAVWQMVTALAAAAVAASLFEVARSMAVLRIESKMDSSLQAAVWDRVLKLPVPFFREYAAGDLALRIHGVNTIRRALSRTTLSALLTGVFSIFSFLLLFHFSAALAVVAAGLVALAMVVSFGIGMVKLGYERRLSAAGGRLSSLVFQYLGGIAKLRAGSAESRAFANWAEAFSGYRRLQFRAQHWGNVEHTLLTGYSTLATAVIFATIGMWLARESGKGLTTGEFIAFSAAFGTFFAGMVTLAETLLSVLNLVPVYERAKPIFDAVPESGADKAHPGELQGGLELANVSFRYGDGPEILKDVSLRVRPGGYIALVGPSGSGKSTLLRLLLGFEKPSAGAIYYDNQELSTLDVQALRRQLGVVLQHGQLVSGDIFTNIAGASSLSLDQAWQAARMVGLDEDIDQMPMGMHTVVGEGVSTLSGGQRQRILIARCIAHRPRILFFDEATSALDNRTQAVVTRSLEQLKATRIVIAHRLSTVINADRIIVLKDGRIVQEGNYQSLIAQPGVFADLARRQIA